MECVCLEDTQHRGLHQSPPSNSISEVLSALISLPAEALPREERRGREREREIAWVLPHHPRNIDRLITVALQPIINTTGATEAGGGEEDEEEEEEEEVLCWV